MNEVIAAAPRERVFGVAALKGDPSLVTGMTSPVMGPADERRAKPGRVRLRPSPATA